MSAATKRNIAVRSGLQPTTGGVIMSSRAEAWRSDSLNGA
jgi:hypothetical protein